MGFAPPPESGELQRAVVGLLPPDVSPMFSDVTNHAKALISDSSFFIVERISSKDG